MAEPTLRHRRYFVVRIMSLFLCCTSIRYDGAFVSHTGTKAAPGAVERVGRVASRSAEQVRAATGGNTLMSELPYVPLFGRPFEATGR